jgi:hypothetical protein
MNTYLHNEIDTNENGIVHGFYSGQNDRVDELNERIQGRQFPDNPLRPNFDPRPVPTKYSLFPVIDRKTPPRFPWKQEYLDNSGFSPATQNGPPKPYLQNIDTETILRNQTVALQHGAIEGVFVPSSNSDLYRVSMPSPSVIQPQAFPNLFVRPSFAEVPSNPIKNQPIGNDIFHNFTRVQLRNTVHAPK